jgi:SSS family solute:Na+ symporter
VNIALTTADVVVIVASLAVVTWVGWVVSRRGKSTAAGYFIASGRMPWWLIGPGLVATSVSSEQIVGTVGAAYRFGMPIGNAEWFTLPTYTLVMLLFVPMYLRSRVVTVPEYYARRFGPLCGDIYSFVMFFAFVFVFLMPVLYGGTLTLTQLLFPEITPATPSVQTFRGIPVNQILFFSWRFQLALWLGSIIVAIYSIRGGLVSVMWTNFLQCFLEIGGGVLLFFIALSKIPGGWGAMVEAAPQRFHLYAPANDPVQPFAGLVVLVIGLGAFYQGTNQVMIQRVMSARSTWDGVMGTIFAGFINFLRPLVTCFLGLVVYHWIHEMRMAPELANLDTAYPFALRELTPSWGIRGVVVAGFIAAVMSTISAIVNSAATIYALDFHKKYVDPQADERKVVRVGQIASMIALFVATLCAPGIQLLGGMFRYFQTFVTYTATPFISVFLLGLLWKRTNYAGALFGLIGGLIIQYAVAFYANFVLPRQFDPNQTYTFLYVSDGTVRMHWLYQGFIAQVITMIGIVLVSLLAPPPHPEQLGALVWHRSYLTDVGREPRPWYKRLILWYTVYAIAWFVIYWHFW